MIGIRTTLIGLGMYALAGLAIYKNPGSILDQNVVSLILSGTAAIAAADNKTVKDLKANAEAAKANSPLPAPPQPPAKP